MRFKVKITGTKISFLKKLILLHLAYEEAEPQLQHFKQLVSLSPKIPLSLKEELAKKLDFKNEIAVSDCYKFMYLAEQKTMI